MTNNLSSYRVALVCHSLEIGGVEAFLDSLAQGLVEHGAKVSIILSGRLGCGHKTFPTTHSQVEALLPKPWETRQGHARRLARRLATFDVVITNASPAAQAILSLLPPTTSVISVVHMSVPLVLSVGTIHATACDRIVAVSEDVREAILARGILNEKVRLIHNGVSCASTWPRANMKTTTPATLRVVFVGRVNHEQKGVLYLPGILARVAQQGHSIHFTVIGDGPDKNALATALYRLPQKITCELVGPFSRAKCRSVLQQSDVFLLPSHYEGLPIALLEAMAEGAVPIVTDLSGRTDIVVEHGINGYLAPIGDETAFASHLINLTLNRGLLLQCSHRAWDTVYQSFSSEVMTSSYCEMLVDLRKRSQNHFRADRDGVVAKHLLGTYPRLPIGLVDLGVGFKGMLRKILSHKQIEKNVGCDV